MLDTLAKIYDIGGPLVNVTSTLFEQDTNFVTAVGLCFESTSMVFRADPDYDTLIASVGILVPLPDETLIDIGDTLPWSDCLGSGTSWLWQLTNQQGYVDGVRIEFGNPGEKSRTVVELIVMASAIYTYILNGAS